jgi:uncharacterized protein YkwD
MKAVCILLAGMICMSSPFRLLARADAGPASMESSVLAYVNAHRKAIGKKPLLWNETAAREAYQHSRNMGSGKTAFGHNGFDARMKNIRKKEGFLLSGAENVASGERAAKEVVNDWLNSPGHRRNIEGDFTYTGIGIYKGRGGVLYFTQVFFRK